MIEYNGITLSDERTVTIKLTDEEQKEILKAYDNGNRPSETLDHVIAKLKDQIWP